MKERTIDPNLVEMLDRALNEVLAGSVTTVGIVCVHVEYGPDEKHVGTQWAHDERGDLFRLLGGLEVLKARVLKQIELPAAADSPE